jgi:transposase
MADRFTPIDRGTVHLFPPSVEDYLPEEHLARFIVDIVDQLDLRSLTGCYGGRGGSRAWHPAMMVSLLLYGYATGTFSSRKLEQATCDSVPYRYICANQHPDHDSICAFRKRFLKELEGLFVQVLAIARQMGVLKLGSVSLDGTKIKANASKHKALSWQYANKLEAQLREEVVTLMQLAEEADNSELPEDLDIPEEIKRREDRLAAIARAKAEIQARAEARYAQEQAEYEAKVAAREQHAKATGKRPGGRDPKPPTAGPGDKDQVNLTDEESRIMPGSGGGFEQSYNAQASVDIDSGLIVTGHVTQQSNDKREVEPTLAQLAQQGEALGKPAGLLADTGYFSAGNVNAIAAAGITPVIAAGRESHNPPLAERLVAAPDDFEPTGDVVEDMRRNLRTATGKALYARRKSTIEPTFGVIKHVQGFRHFLLRGVEAVGGEWNLVCMAFNLKKLHVLQA